MLTVLALPLVAENSGATSATTSSATSSSETFLKPVDGLITVPTGDGAEAFVDAEDIAAVAAATLASPTATPAPSTHRPAPRRSR